MPTIAQDRAFAQELLGGSGLDLALGWINRHLTPRDVFERDELAHWAVENGYEEKADVLPPPE